MTEVPHDNENDPLNLLLSESYGEKYQYVAVDGVEVNDEGTKGFKLNSNTFGMFYFEASAWKYKYRGHYAK